MNSKMNLLIVGSIIAVFAIMIVPNDAIAEIDQNNINVRQINDKMSLEITTVTMTVPENNKLPWGKVWGSSSEVVERYPVIIQFYKENEAVHVAQVDTKGDGSYEYKFRARTVDHNTGESKDICYGDYTVKIFKVIPNTNPTV
ncbi:MAG: hypothetical protein HOF28_01155 [Nitrosopumilus sp.]|nr:hypothetical protein [Nitrosopumilus sp.]